MTRIRLSWPARRRLASRLPSLLSRTGAPCPGHDDHRLLARLGQALVLAAG
jgi:hypothetical protein